MTSASASPSPVTLSAAPSIAAAGPGLHHGRKRLLDGAWLLTSLALALAVGVLDGLGLVRIELGAFFISMAGFALIYLAGSLWAQARPDEPSQERALVWLQVMAVVFLGGLWLQLGGVAVPAIAVLFLLPIATSGLALSRWHPLVSALAVISVVGGVAVITSPGVRGYAGSHGLQFPGWLGVLADRSAALGGVGFLGGPVGQDTATMLVVFFVVAVGVGFVSSRLSTVATALGTAVTRSSGAVVVAQDFADALFEHAPDPLVLIDPRSGTVTRATQSFSRRFGFDEAGPSQSFLDLVAFDLPDQVEPALRGGDVRPTPHSGGGNFGASSLKVRPVTIDGRTLSLVSMADQSLLHKVLTALDTDPDLLMLLDADDRLLWLNEAARGVFGAAGAGNRAGPILESDGLPSGWWEPGPRENVRRPLRIGDDVYEAELRSCRIPGTRRRVVWIRVKSS